MSVKSRFSVYVRAMAIVMLFAMFHYVAGYRLMYSLGILYAKQQAKECMTEKNSNIKKLTLSASDYNSLKWTEKNKEFSYNNDLYDVINIQKSLDKYIITVYYDKTETGWVASLHNVEKRIYSSPQHTNDKSTDIVNNIYKEYIPSESLIPSFYAQVLISIKAKCVLVSVSAKIDDIWHPPAIV